MYPISSPPDRGSFQTLMKHRVEWPNQSSVISLGNGGVEPGYTGVQGSSRSREVLMA